MKVKKRQTKEIDSEPNIDPCGTTHIILLFNMYIRDGCIKAEYYTVGR